MSKTIRQWTTDHWMKIIIPFLIMWGAYVTVGAVKNTLDTRAKTVLHKRISDNKDAIDKQEEKDEIKRNNQKLELLEKIKDREEEVRDLRELVLNLWRLQAEHMEKECGRN